jgi:hypothetical protein
MRPIAMRRTVTAGLALAGMCAASPASAQSDFSHLKVRLGDVVYVTEPTGVVVSGPLTALSPSSLSIDGYDFGVSRVAKIERRGDPIWDGALYGAGVGLLLGSAFNGECAAANGHSCVLPFMIEYSIIGAAIDALHVGRTTIFRIALPASSRLVPFVTPSAAGVALAFGF